METQTKIGKTNLLVNPIGLGTNAVGGHNIYPDLDEQVGKDLVKTALNNGINFLDTAFIYGPKRSEELIGEVLNETGKREDVIVATKGAHKFVGEDVVFDNSPEFLKEAVESSLKRLQTDYIDLFYIHFPDENTPKDEGKIRAIGVSNFSLDQLKEANKEGHVDVVQGEYNLLQRDAEKELLPYIQENNLSFVPYFPLASGLLAGKYDKNTTFNDIRSNMPHFQGEQFEKNLEKVDQVRTIAENHQVEVAHVVLAWYLTRDGIDTIIPGAKRSDQVVNNLKTLDVQLSQEEINTIDRIFS